MAVSLQDRLASTCQYFVEAVCVRRSKMELKLELHLYVVTNFVNHLLCIFYELPVDKYI